MLCTINDTKTVFESNCLPQNAMLANFQNEPRVDKEKKKDKSKIDTRKNRQKTT